MSDEGRRDPTKCDVDVFDEYRLFIEDTAQFSERRQKISNTYIAVNSLLLTAIGLLIKDSIAQSSLKFLLPLPLVVAGIGVCLWWRQLIRKYKELVGLRMEVLREMEQMMRGSVRMYHLEDALYPRDEKGKPIPDEGLNFSDIEAKLPILFIVLYALFGLLVLFIFFGFLIVAPKTQI